MSLIRYGHDVPTFVKTLRADLGLSQTELGKMIGVHGQYVSNVERGVHKNPIGFVSLLFTICPRDRKEYLMDLASDAGSARAVEKIRRSQRGGKWNDRRKS